MKRTYPQGPKGWHEVPRTYYMACCDCCLVHKICFRVRHGRVQIKVNRENKCTAALRRHRNVKVKTIYKDENGKN